MAGNGAIEGDGGKGVGTVEFSSEISISSSFTAERAENAEALEKPSVDWNTLKLCALCDLRVDKSLVF